ncbi:MAG: hypothetical protein LBQ76_08525 [Candidatus Fibromonas sp.]|nr:hypothetical protein [Candidatus Fibromonas sp.]
MSSQTLDNATFKTFVDSLKPLIDDMMKKYGSKLAYSDSEEARYWNGVKTDVDEGEKWLLGIMNSECKNLDRHKYSALLFVVLIKRPLFKDDISNESVGRCSSGIYFAWKAALNLLAIFIKGGDLYDARYLDYIKKNGVSMPSEAYVYETLRSLQTVFRPFKKERKPAQKTTFPSMMNDCLPCSNEVWGFALLFANTFSLIESNSIARLERKLLHDKLKEK